MYLLHILVVLINVVIVISDRERTPLFRCCPKNESLSNDFKCVPIPKEWKPLVLRNDFSEPLNATGLEAAFKQWDIRHERPKCSKNQKERLVFNYPPFLILENGSMWYSGYIIPPASFCVDDKTAIFCVKEDNTSINSEGREVAAEQIRRVYVKKCCHDDVRFSESVQHCADFGSKRSISLPQFLQNTTSLSVLNVSNTFFEYGFPDCSEGYIKSGRLSEHNSSLQQDGSLSLPTAKVILAPKEFCLEYIKDQDDTVPTIFTCSGKFPVPVNGTNLAIDKYDIRLTIYALGLFVSAFFLAATLATSWLLPTTHHMLHWRCQSCHVACLMIGDLLLAITQIASSKFSLELCQAFAILTHVFFLAAFFWLNTMCFNIWWTFRDLRPTSLDKGQEAWRLRIYELYAWGFPIIIGITAVVFDNLPREDFPSVLRPNFGEKSCWFQSNMEVLAYFYGPIGVLLLLNLILFLLTARELTCGLWKSEVVKSTTERATLGRVCLKLVVVMGITWIADVASWAVGGPQYLWYITDIINTLQGVFIFIVVGCQPQIWAAVKRLWCLKETTTTSVNGNQQSFSQDVPSMGDSVSNNTQNTSIKVPAGETTC